MACTVKELREWLDSLDAADGRLIAIDDGGLTLVLVPQEGFAAPYAAADDFEAHFEIGGVPLKEVEQ